MISIKNITSKQTFALRIDILRNGVTTNYQFDADNEPSSIHLAAIENQHIIGVLSLIKHKFDALNINDAYQLRGMAIALAHQKKGIGNMLIKYSERILKEKNVAIVWCNARETAVDFYKKNGYKKYGEIFEISTIGSHYIMYKKLN